MLSVPTAKLATARSFGAGVDQLAVDRVGEHAEDALGARPPSSRSSAGDGGQGAAPDLDLMLGAEPLEGREREACG